MDKKIGYPKKKRIVDKNLVSLIMNEQKHCLLQNMYGECYGNDCPHHVKSRGSGGNDERGNIFRCCLVHHQKIHNGLIPKSVLYNILDNL